MLLIDERMIFLSQMRFWAQFWHFYLILMPSADIMTFLLT